MRLNRWTGSDQRGVNSKDVVKYSLDTGSGDDIIRVEKASSVLAQGVHIKANAGNDEVYIGSEAVGFDEIFGTAYVDGEGGVNKLTYLDDKGTTARAYVLGLSDVANWDMRFAVVAPGSATYSHLFSKYTLRGTPLNDTVQVDATDGGAADGTHVFTNNGNDAITVGSAKDGLKFVTGKLFVTGGDGMDGLIVDDKSGAAGKFTVTANKIEKGGLIIESDVLHRTINGAPARNLISILGNPGGAEGGLALLSGPDGDSVEVAGANAVHGAVSIDGQGGSDIIKVFVDLLDPTLTNLEKLELAAGVVTLNTTAALFEDILQTGGTLAGAADVTASKSLTWQGGTMSGSGTTFSSAVAEVSSNPTLSRVLDLTGSTLWTAHILGSTGTVLNHGLLDAVGAATDGSLSNVGTLRPGGANATGTVTVGGDFSHTGGSMPFEFQSGSADKIVVTGKVTLGGGLDLVPLAGPYSVRYTLIDNAMLDSVVGSFAGYAPGALVTALSPRKYTMNYAGGNGNDVLLDNFAPDAVNDAFTINEDTATEFEVLGNDTDPENDALTITTVGQAMHGTATISGSKILYTPALNYHGTDSFQYTISDGNGGTDTATVSVTITPVNDNPTAVNDVASVPGSFTSYLMVLGNDSDVDGNMISLSGIPVAPTKGTASISGNMIQYTPNAGFAGTDTLTYEISDGAGGFATAVVAITVTGGGGPPGGGGAGMISGLLFHDANQNGIQDFGEFYIGTSVEVRLLDANGVTVATTWTSGAVYSFTNITAGTYRIQVIPPSGYSFSPQDQGGNDNTDSDVDSSGYTSFFLFNGTAFLDFDAGIYIG
jgi:hypothetical protein